MGVTESREAIRQQLARAQSQGPEERLAAASLAAMFNRYATAEQRLPTVSPMSLEVTSRIPLTARRRALIQDKVTRAVTWIGHSMQHPDEDPQRLHEAHFVDTDLQLQMSPSGGVVLVPDIEPSLLFEGIGHVETLAERAMTRLVNVLPMSANDDTFEARVIELPPTERKAVLEITEIAKRLNGIGAHLVGAEVVDASMSVDQADDLAHLLTEIVTGEPERLTLTGRLDGLRFKRQRFWLEAGDGREYEGSVDANLLPRMREMLDKPVEVVVLATTPKDKAGRPKRTTYLLADVRLADQGPASLLP